MMLAVGKNTKHPEIAAKFVNWLVADEAAIKILGSSRGAPMSKTQLDLLIKNKTFSDIELKALKQIQSAKIDLPSPYIEHADIQKWVREVFDKVASGSISEVDAARLLVTDTNLLLTKISK